LNCFDVLDGGNRDQKATSSSCSQSCASCTAVCRRNCLQSGQVEVGWWLADGERGLQSQVVWWTQGCAQTVQNLQQWRFAVLCRVAAHRPKHPTA
jgi:hypothetical protein